MAHAVGLVFEGVSEDQYWAVNDKLGIERDGSGDWPAGLVSHAGGPRPDSGWVVSEIWTSSQAQGDWMATRLGAALAEVGVPAPVQVITSDLVNHQLPG